MVPARCTLRAVLCISLILLTAFTSVALADPLVLEVSEASVTADQRTNKPIVVIGMTSASAKAWTIFTQANVGRMVEVRLDGEAVGVPFRVRDVILGGSMPIFGLTSEEARRVIVRLYRGGTIEVAPSAN
jgi:preprotein translocase subunit SecD